MTTNYIAVAPGTDYPTITLRVHGSVSPANANVSISSLKDVKISMSNDIKSMDLLNESSKLQVVGTSTNTITSTYVLEPETFWGNASAGAGSAAKSGLFGLSDAKTKVDFWVNVGNGSGTGTGSVVLSGVGCIAGLDPSVASSTLTWESPVTIAVSGSFTKT